jgi:hypothetical protein
MIKNNNSDTQLNIKKKRPGVHAKSKSSTLKTSKNYKKAYRGQGK